MSTEGSLPGLYPNASHYVLDEPFHAGHLPFYRGKKTNLRLTQNENQILKTKVIDVSAFAV